MNNSRNIQLITAAILAIGGLVLLFCGVYIDPQGEIHETLLVAFGEVATFAGSIMGIDYSYKHRYGNKENAYRNKDKPPGKGSERTAGNDVQRPDVSIPDPRKR